MGNTQSSEEINDDFEILHGSTLNEERGNLDKNHKIYGLLDYISNENNFNFKINLKCNANYDITQNSIKNLGDDITKKNTIITQSNEEEISFNNMIIKNSTNDNSNNNNFINFYSLGTTGKSRAYDSNYYIKNNTSYSNNNTSSNKGNYKLSSNQIRYNLFNKSSNRDSLNNFNENNIEMNINLLNTFSKLKDSKEKILKGNIIKIGFVGRQNNNLKLLNSFFINEKNPYKVDVYCVDMVHGQNDKNSCFNYKSNCCNKNVSNSYCFFANADYIDICTNYFASYHKTGCFAKECEFKNDLFSENYGNCIELDLNDFANLIDYLCEYDIVIYCIDKMNENIKTESKYLDYLIKRFPIFKYLIENKRFFIVLNKFSCEKNSLYQYQNDEANIILNKLNQKFENKLIYELDLNKTYEEKIIYFYKILKKYDRNYLFEKNFPILNNNTKNNNLNNLNEESSKASFNNKNSNKNEKNKYIKFSNDNGKTITTKFTKFDFNQNFYQISDMFEKIITKKFILKNSNYVTPSNCDKLKSKVFCEFYENFMKDNNYHCFDFNKAIEFDKTIYDSINELLILKLENFYQEFIYEKSLNDIDIKKFFNGLKSNNANFLDIKEDHDQNFDKGKNIINENLDNNNKNENKKKELNFLTNLNNENLENIYIKKNLFSEELKHEKIYEINGNYIAIHEKAYSSKEFLIENKLKDNIIINQKSYSFETPKKIKGILKKSASKNTNHVKIEENNYFGDSKILNLNKNRSEQDIQHKYFSNNKKSKNTVIKDYFTFNLSDKIIKTNSNLSNYSNDNLELESFGKVFSKEKIEDKISKIEKKINENFDYIKKEIIPNISCFLIKFNFLNEKIENMKKITSESKNLKGEKINVSKLNFLFEIFDIYGINHYYTSMSIEMVNYYYNNLKKMFLNFIKLLNHSILIINALENNIVNIHENLKQNFENSHEIKLPRINFNNYFNNKLESQKFFHSLFFKLFIVENIKFKPLFAFYNFTNFAGFIISLIFFIRAIRKLFKFQPNHHKIIKYLLCSLSSIFLTYFVSFILNKFYNKKTEKKFNRLTQRVSFNIKYIINTLNNIEKLIEDYRNKYILTSLNFLNKINDKI